MRGPLLGEFDAASGAVMGLVNDDSPQTSLPVLSAAQMRNLSGFVAPLMAEWSADTAPAWLPSDYFWPSYQPNIFYDPTATTSLNYGTYSQPYNSAAILAAAVTGDMAGKRLGIKRGTLTRGGILLNAYSSSASAPFIVLPYGDALAMPIVSGSKVFAATGNQATGWAQVSGAGYLWKVNLSAEGEAFDTSISDAATINRLWKVASPPANEAAAITALNAAGPGWSAWVSATGTLYVFPFAGAPDWSAVEVTYRLSGTVGACTIDCTNAAGQGANVAILGLAVRNAQYATIQVKSGASGSLGAVAVVGCDVRGTGVNSVAESGVGVGNGVSVVHTSTQLHAKVSVLGCRVFDSIQHACELWAMSSGEVAYNRSAMVQGRTITELWTRVSACLVHDNIGVGQYGSTRPSNIGTGGMGVYIPAYDSAAAVQKNSALSANNEIFRNLMLAQTAYGIYSFGAGLKIYSNTIAIAHNNFNGYGVQISDDQVSHTASAAVINNNIYGIDGTAGDSLSEQIAGQITVSTKNNLWNAQYTSNNLSAGSNYGIAAWNTLKGGADVAVNPSCDATGKPANAALFNAGQIIAGGYTRVDAYGKPYLWNGTDTAPAIGARAR